MTRNRNRGLGLGRFLALAGSRPSAIFTGAGAQGTQRARAGPFVAGEAPQDAEQDRHRFDEEAGDPPGSDLSQESAPLIADLESRCERDFPALLERYPPTRFLEIYDQHADSPYWSVSAETRAFVDAIEREYGDQAVLLFKQLLVAYSVARRSMPVPPLVVPRALAGDIDRERTRMLADIRAGTPDYTAKFGDYFLKDLAVARLHMVPSGPHVAELSGGVPRRVLVTGGVRQFLDVSFTFYVRLRPFRPMLHIHLSEKALRDFTAEGRERCFLQMAEVLRANPRLAGVCAASWLYDPAVPRVSPHLWFMQEPARSHGAKFFRLQSDEQSRKLATLKSATRRRLFEAGEYIPTAYAMAWFRKDLLRWAQARVTPAPGCE